MLRDLAIYRFQLPADREKCSAIMLRDLVPIAEPHRVAVRVEPILCTACPTPQRCEPEKILQPISRYFSAHPVQASAPFPAFLSLLQFSLRHSISSLLLFSSFTHLRSVPYTSTSDRSSETQKIPILCSWRRAKAHGRGGLQMRRS